MYAPNDETYSVFSQIYQERFFEKWRSCTVVLTGIGTYSEDCLQNKEKLFSEADYIELGEKGAVGDLLGRWFNESGECIDCSCNHRVISMPFDILKTIPIRLLVAYGEQKVNSIKSVLRKKLINVLVTDEMTARKILE